MEIIEYPGATYTDIEIYISGEKVHELSSGFDEVEDNPEIVSLFNPQPFDEKGDYNGDGCDRLELNKGMIWAAMDGLRTDSVKKVAQDCIICAEKNPDLSYLIVGIRVIEPDEDSDLEDEEICYDVLFRQGFLSDNPIKTIHGKFYDEFTVRGI